MIDIRARVDHWSETAEEALRNRVAELEQTVAGLKQQLRNKEEAANMLRAILEEDCWLKGN